MRFFLVIALLTFPYRGIAFPLINATHVEYALMENVMANGDIAKFYENTIYSIPVLNNDFGLASGVKSLKVTKAPKNGTVKVMPDRTIQFTPIRNFTGYDEFEYEVCANEGGCSIGSVFVEVVDFDYKPVLANDTFTVTTANSKKLELDILKNDYGIYDEPIKVTIVSDLINGTLRVNTNNTVTAIFNSRYEGPDSALYRVCDANDDCDTALVFFNVTYQSGESMFVPTGISPNGDGLNDEFYIPDLKGYANLQIQVFTQWGNLVYDDNQYQNNWNGYANKGNQSGNLLPAGVYYYLIKAVGSDINLAGYLFINR
jgi:gliding motility-associated-like protein